MLRIGCSKHYWFLQNVDMIKRKGLQWRKEYEFLMRIEFCKIPVKLKHSAGNSHSSWHLKRHSAKDILQVAGVGMKGGFVQLLRIDNLFSGSIGWLFANSIRYKERRFSSDSKIQCVRYSVAIIFSNKF